jgi:hypothetical protein
VYHQKAFDFVLTYLSMGSSGADALQVKNDDDPITGKHNVETRRYQFLRKRYCSTTFWEEEDGTFDGDGLFHREVLIEGRRAAATVDRSSTVNLVSIEVVEKLQLSKCAHATPYLLPSSYGALLISYTAKVPITIGDHTEVVPCGVSPMPLDSCHVLLGHPWCHNFQVQLCEDINKISLKWNMRRRSLMRASAEHFHENHLLRKERTKEFCLSP